MNRPMPKQELMAFIRLPKLIKIFTASIDAKLWLIKETEAFVYWK